MEEYVGQLWHRLVTRASDREFPEEAVLLEEVKKDVALFFRALGGDGGLRVINSLASGNNARRGLLQKIAGTGKTSEYAVRDEQSLQLPWSIAHYPDKKLNKSLYIWLCALASVPPEAGLNWVERSRRQTSCLLQEWPGLESIYGELVARHLESRGEIENIPAACRPTELLIRQVLLNPHDVPALELPEDASLWRNVPLWLHPEPPDTTLQEISGRDLKDDESDSDSEESEKKKQESDDKRHKAETTDDPDGRSGLLAFRLESMFSWTEFLKVDRTTEDNEDENALDAANDMDFLSVSHDQQTISSKLKLDLDLPSENHDDLKLGKGILLPEWDFKTGRLQEKHCSLQNFRARDAVACEIPAHLRSQARKLRRHFESLRSERVWLRHQNDGTEVDMDAYIAWQSSRLGKGTVSDEGMYRQLHKSRRDLSCLLLADLSLSTDTYVNDDSRVIDMIRDSLFLFSEALQATSDRFAIHGFSSRRRDHVRFHRIKEFAENYNADVRGRISTIKPGYYTRMGAAIRYSTTLLKNEPSNQKLLLILTDGKPNDLDKYEGRYGIEDTREALSEARRAGLEPFCVTIDEKAQEYLPYLFGSNAYVRVKRLEELPRKLPLLYARLTA